MNGYLSKVFLRGRTKHTKHRADTLEPPVRRPTQLSYNTSGSLHPSIAPSSFAKHKASSKNYSPNVGEGEFSEVQVRE
jgi:hypothetical protein